MNSINTKRNIGIAEALNSLCPGAKWTCLGKTYDDIIWHDTSQSIPSEDEIINEISRLKTEYDNKEYQRLRAREYPSFAEQFDILYHGGYDEWKKTIDNVKQKYPKS